MLINGVYLKRFAEESLEKWLKSPRKKPMVIRGARQVGKSTLVRQFAKSQNLTLNEINLERHLELEKVFSSLNISLIRSELEGLLGRSILKPDSLLFLDEIQATPSALQALRYFYEDLPQIPVVAAGSLLEFTLSNHKFSMPVGRIIYQFLGPLTFEEFLEENSPSLIQYLKSINFEKPISQTAFKKIEDQLYKYMFIGGMPEAVSAFSESGSMEEVTDVHRSLSNTYEDDFAKYANKSELIRLQRIFRQIPRLVGKKVKYVNFSREEGSREVKSAIELLSKANLCCKIHSSRCSGIPLAADIDESVYKLIFLDVGLMNHVCGLDWSAINKLDKISLINKGAIAEQLIGQHLAWPAEGKNLPRPVYWLREGRKNNAEVDFVVSKGSEIFPLEVKSGKSGILRSLHEFVNAKKITTAIRFDLNQPSKQSVMNQSKIKNESSPDHFIIKSLPLFAIGELDRLLN